MARPRKDSQGPSARERIESAFWELLEQKGYGGITVAALSRTANVSPNTFYYHYDNIEAVARNAFDETLIREFPRLILEGPRERLDAAVSAHKALVEQRVHRIALFASSESGFLRGIVVDSFVRVWMGLLDIEESDLSDDERMRVGFIAHGMLSILGRAGATGLVEIYPAFLASPLGRGIVEEMKALKASHAKNGAGRKQDRASRDAARPVANGARSAAWT